MTIKNVEYMGFLRRTSDIIFEDYITCFAFGGRILETFW